MYSVQMFISVHLSWMSEGNCFQCFCDRATFNCNPSFAACKYTSVWTIAHLGNCPALLEHGFCCLGYVGYKLQCRGGEGGGKRNHSILFTLFPPPFPSSNCAHPQFHPKLHSIRILRTIFSNKKQLVLIRHFLWSPLSSVEEDETPGLQLFS